ncbi:hypothetical protein ACJX0J_015940, partial [Zea mays]
RETIDNIVRSCLQSENVIEIVFSGLYKIKDTLNELLVVHLNFVVVNMSYFLGRNFVTAEIVITDGFLSIIYVLLYVHSHAPSRPSL